MTKADPKEPMVDARLLRDVWDEDGTRHKAGEGVSVPLSAYEEGFESGLMKRAEKANAD